MNYSKIYDNLILFRKKLNPLKKSKLVYTEVHHITPKCLGGSNDIENLVRLTAREHFLAHRLLSKLYPENIGLSYAVLKMGKIGKEGTKINSNEYKKLRERVSQFVSKNNKERWRKMSSEERDKQISTMSEYNRNMTIEQRLEKAEKIKQGHKLISDEVKKDISEKRSNWWSSLSEEELKERGIRQSEINKERFSNMTCEERDKLNIKISLGHANKTQKEKEKMRKKMSKAQQSISPEKRKLMNEKLRKSALERESKMTPEAKAERSRKMKEGRERKKKERGGVITPLW